jgi:cellulose synthase/poly-beta-1,6-N-acetylglucosamine synthase-like glycosyltransferase
LDADSVIDKKGLVEMAKQFSDGRMDAVSGIVRAEYNINPLTWFQDFEYIQSSAWRFICNKVNATYIFPGFAAFRKDAFLKAGGFSSDTYSEDFEIGLRLRKAGCKVGMSKAVMYTRVPETIRGLIKQRTRWGRGTVQVMRKHRDMILNWRYGVVGLYGIPTQIYWYIHGFVYIPILVYQVSEGYYKYFLANDVYFSIDVIKYFIGWFSVYGTIEYVYKTFQGYYEMTIVFVLLVIMFSLYLIYNLLVLYAFAHPKKRHFFVIFFFFPYSLFSLLMHITPSLTEIFKPTGSNIWEKSR